MKTFKIKKAKRSSYLIGDSEKHGKNQVLSLPIRYNKDGLFDEENKLRIEMAKKLAENIQASNIRIVTQYYDAICLKSGVIDYKRSRTTTKKFDL